MSIRRDMDYQLVFAENRHIGVSRMAVTRTDDQYRTLVLALEEMKLASAVTVKDLEILCEEGTVEIGHWVFTWVIQESEGLALDLDYGGDK